jgi:hypothetical protein
MKVKKLSQHGQTLVVIALSGPPGPQTEENPYGGLFLYMPMSNSGTITINEW